MLFVIHPLRSHLSSSWNNRSLAEPGPFPGMLQRKNGGMYSWIPSTGSSIQDTLPLVQAHACMVHLSGTLQQNHPFVANRHNRSPCRFFLSCSPLAWLLRPGRHVDRCPKSKCHERG